MLIVPLSVYQRGAKSGSTDNHISTCINVQELFASMRETTTTEQQQHLAPPVKTVGSSSVSSNNPQNAPIDSTNNTCQHFEVLYVGKIKVSHCKAPPTFIDEALERFRQHEVEKLRIRAAQSRQRHISSTGVIGASPKETDPMERSISVRENDLRRQLGQLDTWRRGSSMSENLNTVSTNPAPVEVTRTSSANSLAAPWHLGSTENIEVDSPTGRARSNSGDAIRFRQLSSSGTDLSRRSRSDTAPPSPCGNEQNRTMLFQISASELSLISLDKKLVILHKVFTDISHCSQGIKHTDYFGFICRDASVADTYVGYVFKCQAQAVTDEIMGALKQAFNTAAQVYHTQHHQSPSATTPTKAQFCETCPMLWLYRMCVEVEGSSPNRAHSIIQKHLEMMTEDEQRELKDKFEGAEVTNAEAQNEVMLMLIRALCETKQTKHAHTGDLIYKADLGSLDRKHSSVLEDLKKKAKRSLTNSFENIVLKVHRKTRDEAREAFRERSQTIDMDSNSNRNKQNALGSHTPQMQRPRKDSLVDTTDSSDMQPCTRPRSSTVGSTMNIRSGRNAAAAAAASAAAKKSNSPSPVAPLKPSPKMNIFIKVGNQAKTPSPEEEKTPKRKLSWRQTIYQQVKSIGGISPPMVKASDGSSPDPSPSGRRSPATLRALWKKAIMEQILLIRMEKENRKLKASQDAAQSKRMKLDYEEITPCLKEVTKVWEDMLASPGRPGEMIDHQKILDAVKAGIPRHKRGEIWQLLSEQQSLRRKTASPSVAASPLSEDAVSADLNASYEDLLRQLTSHQHAILIDLGRTFPHHPYFSMPLGPGQLALFNLLKAYSLLDKEVGYCQGLSFIAGVLLLHQMEENRAFEMLKHMLFHQGIRRQYKPDMVALQIQMYQLSRLVHDTYPDLYQHFEKQEIAPTLYAAPWFLTMFASQFPLGFVARVFDLLFLNGMDVVFKVALVLLGNHKELIMQCTSFESVMEFLKTTLPSLGIIQMERVFNQVFAMDISRELHAYEVEYQVLQEEMFSGNTTPSCRSDSDAVQRLETTNQSLKRENSELQDQLQLAQTNIDHLETMMTTYQSNIGHLEKRIKELELDRCNLKRTVETLRRKLPDLTDAFCSSEPDLLVPVSSDMLRAYQMPRSSSHNAIGGSGGSGLGSGDHSPEDKAADSEVANTMRHHQHHHHCVSNGTTKVLVRHTSDDSWTDPLSLNNSPIME